MEQTATLTSAPRTDAEYEAALDRYLVEMEHLKAEMDERQQRIEKSRAETEAGLARLEALI